MFGFLELGNPTRRISGGQAVRLVANNAERSKNRGIAFSSQFLLDYCRIDGVLAGVKQTVSLRCLND